MDTHNFLVALSDYINYMDMRNNPSKDKCTQLILYITALKKIETQDHDNFLKNLFEDVKTNGK